MTARPRARPLARPLLVVAVLIACSSWAATAAAAGLLLGPQDLTRQDRVALTRAVAEARRRAPDSFTALGRLRRDQSSQRATRPSAARSLRRLGSSALFPMLEALALDASGLTGLGEDEGQALAIGMVEALGSLRDGRAAPVLRAVFARAPMGDLSRAAAEALGRSCDERALLLLRRALGAARRAAAIDGLGQCRRAEATELLAAALDAAADEGETRRLALALGRQASSWAWRALGPEHEQTGLRVRRRASEALVRSYGRQRGRARAAHRAGLRMAAHPDLEGIVRRLAAGADEETQRSLQAIAAAVSSR